MQRGKEKVTLGANLRPYNIMVETKIRKEGITSNCALQASPVGSSNQNMSLNSPLNNWEEGGLSTFKSKLPSNTADYGTNVEINPNLGLKELKMDKPEQWNSRRKVPRRTSAATAPILILIDHPPEQFQINQAKEEEANYEEEQFDDLIVEDTMEKTLPTNPLPCLPMMEMDPIIISDDPPFTEQDLDGFINNELGIQKTRPLISDGSFHSMQNSLHSTSSFAVEMGKFEMNQHEESTSKQKERY